MFLISVRAPVGDVNLAANDCAIGRGLAALRVHPEKGDNYFLIYALMLNKARIASLGSGTTFQSINNATLKGFEISFPPATEQKAIVKALRSMQDAKDARTHETQLERERKAALMAHLFAHGTRGEALAETPFGKLPQSWNVVTIDEVAATVSGGTPSREMPEYWNGTVSWVKTGEINYKVIKDTGEKITHLGLENSSARIISAGTVLMAMYGQGVTRGRVALLGIDAAINQACCAIKHSAQLSPEYLFYFLASTYDKIRNLGHGANQTNLNAAMIRSIELPLPPLDEQQEIADILRACDDKIAALEDEATRLDELFRAMLEELMSGRLRVPDTIEQIKRH